MVDEPDFDLDTRLQQVGQQVRRLRELERVAAAARGKLTELTAREHGHRQRAERAAQDLAHARSFWPTALLARLTGKGRQDVQAAEYVIAAAKSAIDALEPQLVAAQADVDRGEAARRTFAGIGEAHAELLRLKEDALRIAGGIVGERAATLAAHVAVLRHNDKECRRMREYARDAATSLEQARDLFVDASNQGRLVSSPMVDGRKSRTIEMGTSAVDRALQVLQYVAEAALAGDADLGTLELEDGRRLAEVFAVGVWSAMPPQSGLVEALSAARRHLAMVHDLLRCLERESAESSERLAAAEAERAAWLESVRV